MNFITQLQLAWRHWPTHRKVWALAVPMILSNLTIPLVTLVDSSVVGHLPHAHQLGAVAVGASFYSVMASLTMFLRMTTTGFAAQAAGQRNDTLLQRILLQSLIMALGLALLLAILSEPFLQLGLLVMNPSDELRAMASSFFHIRLFGLPATLTQYALVGWLLGRQNARAPLAMMVVTNSVNIVLALWFVLGLKWGVDGAAIASVCAEWTGILWGLFLVRSSLISMPSALRAPALRVWKNWSPLLSANRDIFLRSLALHCVFVGVTIRGGQLGDDTVAANALLLNGLMVSAYALDGLAHALEALCGYAIGQRRLAALRRALVVAGGWSFAISAVFAVGFLFWGKYFVAMQSDIPTVRAAAAPYLPYLAMLPMVAVWSYLLDGLFIGATRAREMRNGMLLSLLLTAPLAWLLRDYGNHGLWIALLFFMAMRAATLGWIGWQLHLRKQWIPNNNAAEAA